MKRLLHAIASSVIVLCATAAPSIASASPEFCWRDSKPRGVGTIPTACAAGKEQIGLLCYSKCPDGMKRAGFDCHSNCPEGLRDDGLFCRAAEYGRGGGYPWKPKDGLKDQGMKRRCEAVHGQDQCEKNGAIYYPKCRPGYHAFGCCICRPDVPDCEAKGLNPGLDLSCAKKIRIGDPKPRVCNDGQDYDAGLCYKKCPAGYRGVGPVCWAQAPKGWVDCGMGVAKDKKTCGGIIFDQVTSVGGLALNIATLGTSTAATGAGRGAQSAEELSKLRKMFEDLKVAYKQVEPALIAKKVIGAGLAAEELKSADQLTAEDIARVAAKIAAITDPTGVAGTVGAYTYPKCSKYSGLQQP